MNQRAFPSKVLTHHPRCSLHWSDCTQTVPASQTSNFTFYLSMFNVNFNDDEITNRHLCPERNLHFKPPLLHPSQLYYCPRQWITTHPATHTPDAVHIPSATPSTVAEKKKEPRPKISPVSALASYSWLPTPTPPPQLQGTKYIMTLGLRLHVTNRGQFISKSLFLRLY